MIKRGYKVTQSDFNMCKRETAWSSTANERYVKRQVSVIRAGAPSHFPTEYRHEAAVVSREHIMKSVVLSGDRYQ